MNEGKSLYMLCLLFCSVIHPDAGGNHVSQNIHVNILFRERDSLAPADRTDNVVIIMSQRWS